MVFGVVQFVLSAVYCSVKAYKMPSVNIICTDLKILIVEVHIKSGSDELKRNPVAQ